MSHTSFKSVELKLLISSETKKRQKKKFSKVTCVTGQVNISCSPVDPVLLSWPSDLQHKDSLLRSPAGEWTTSGSLLINSEVPVNQTKMLMRLWDYFRVSAAASAHMSVQGAQAPAYRLADTRLPYWEGPSRPAAGHRDNEGPLKLFRHSNVSRG